MIRYVFKDEDHLTPEDLHKLEELLVPLFSWSYHFSQSYKNSHTLYFGSKPKWRLFLYDDNELIGSLSIVERKIENPFPIVIGGVGNVAIKKSHQGKGLALKMLQEAHKFMKKQGISMSLLFCIERLKGVYLKAGYLQTEKPVVYHSGAKNQEEPLALFYPLLLGSKEISFIQQNGLDIGQGSW